MTQPSKTEPVQGEVVQPDPRTPEEIRRSRNKVLGLSLAAFVVLVFLISIAKMG
ncbi:hypothetical protein [Novosphingobium sp. KA1]|uniref:hypothetical protein n=1 Tax=Novosphingobium sp. (strain KA1) TaxID=164608 RepID=UPI001A8F7670|nr:hypothetical protein [Novosphingobium sp. KA1]